MGRPRGEAVVDDQKREGLAEVEGEIPRQINRRGMVSTASRVIRRRKSQFTYLLEDPLLGPLGCLEHIW